jgi:hypothetical protein
MAIVAAMLAGLSSLTSAGWRLTRCGYGLHVGVTNGASAAVPGPDISYTHATRATVPFASSACRSFQRPDLA